MNNGNNGNHPKLQVEQKIRRWTEEEHIPEQSDDELSAFDRAAHKIEGFEVVYLKKPSVREVFGHLYERYESTDRAFLARTVSEITDSVDFGQSTVTKAIQELEQVPVVTRMSHASTRDNVIGLVTPVASHLGKGMEEFKKTARISSPPENSRAEGIRAVFERHSSEKNQWRAQNNIEIWYRGELMGLVPDTDLDISAVRDGRGLLDVTIRPVRGEIPEELWDDIQSHSQALTQGFASLAGYDPETGEYPSLMEAAECVATPGGCGCNAEQCGHWIIDFVETKH
jgi:hypothetical protein